MDLVIASKNKKKLQEIKDILKGVPLRIISLADYPRAPRIREDGKTFQENAIKKAVKIARFTGKLTLGEDSGLCVDALGGGPGIYSSRFAGKNKSDRQNNQKVLRLLGNLPLKKRKAHYVCAVALADKDKLVAITGGKCNGLIGFAPQGSFGFGYDPIFIPTLQNRPDGSVGTPSVPTLRSEQVPTLRSEQVPTLRSEQVGRDSAPKGQGTREPRASARGGSIIPKYQKTFAQLGEKIKHKMSHRYYALEKAKKVLKKYIEQQQSS